jgi:tRNA threonylcarbamoyladenosine biosynthesis protein TsaE
MPTELSSSPEATRSYGKRLVQSAAPEIGKKPVVFALTGDLGTGKTHMVKGIAEELGITDLITSPSYTLVNEYEFTWDDHALLFAHIDAWRLEQITHLESLGWTHFLERNAVIALEWSPEKALIPLHVEAHIIQVKLEYGQEENHRLISHEEVT